MYALSLSSAFYLLDMPTVALAVAAIGTTLGWSFLVLTFLPVIVHSLFRNQEHAFLRWFIVTSVVTVHLVESYIVLFALFRLVFVVLILFHLAGTIHKSQSSILRIVHIS